MTKQPTRLTPWLLIVIATIITAKQAVPKVNIDETAKISFVKLGRAFPSQGFATLRIELRIDEIESPIKAVEEQLEAAIKRIKKGPAREQTQSLIWTLTFLQSKAARALSTIHRFTEMAERSDEEQVEWQETIQESADDEKSAVGGRAKREPFTIAFLSIISLISVSSLGTSLYALLGSSSNSDEIVQKMQEDETAHNTNADAIQTLNDFVKITEIELRELRGVDIYGFIKTMFALERMAEVVETVEKVYSGVLAGHFPLALVSHKGMAKTMTKLRAATKKKGYRVLLSNPNELHMCKTSFLATKQGIIVTVLVPIVAKAEHLFVFKTRNWPIQTPAGDWIQMNLGQEEILIVDQHRKRFRTTSLAELNSCLHIRDTFVCELANTLRKNKPAPNTDPELCLISMFSKDFKGIKRHCRVQKVDPTPMMVQTAERSFMVRTINKEKVEIFCENGDSATIDETELSHFTMKPGCTAETSTHIGKAVTEAGHFKKGEVTLTWSPSEDFNVGWEAITISTIIPGKNGSLHMNTFDPITPERVEIIADMIAHWDPLQVFKEVGKMMLFGAGVIAISGLAYYAWKAVQRGSQHKSAIQFLTTRDIQQSALLTDVETGLRKEQALITEKMDGFINHYDQTSESPYLELQNEVDELRHAPHAPLQPRRTPTRPQAPRAPPSYCSTRERKEEIFEDPDKDLQWEDADPLYLRPISNRRTTSTRRSVRSLSSLRGTQTRRR
jgi:hypothetical protein